MNSNTAVLHSTKAADVIPLATWAGIAQEIWDDFLKPFQSFWSRFLTFLWLFWAILAVQSNCKVITSILLGRRKIWAFKANLVIWREKVFCKVFDNSVYFSVRRQGQERRKNTQTASKCPCVLEHALYPISWKCEGRVGREILGYI